MVEIPSDQDSWLGDVDAEDVYDEAGLDTGDDEGGNSAQSLAQRLLNKLR
jgi:hypothetical protein